MRYAQLVMGPAGSGKSTFCSVVARHAEITKRDVNIVNLGNVVKPIFVDTVQRFSGLTVSYFM